MWQAVKRFSANQYGRDFVVGDIHGAYDLVIDGMRAAKFDYTRDRLFAVGDLLDRGPDSHRVRKFLEQPYVHAIRGNHEAMLLDIYRNGEADEAMLAFNVMRNGLGWWLNVPELEQRFILAALARLPLAIEVETPRGVVGLVHADVPAGMCWETFVSHLEAGDDATVQTALWGRNRITHGSDAGVQGIGRVFVGHTPQWGGLKRFGNVYAIDTGAIAAELHNKPGAQLTMANMVAATQLLCAPKTTSPLALLDAPEFTSSPFGAYAQSA